MTPVGWAQARAAAHAAADPLPAAEVPLADAAGATLARPLRAATPVPGFACSAMDGYAVGSAAGPWRLVGTRLAGDRAGDPLRPGEAVRIATGAATPPGTYAVLPDEDATGTGGAVAAGGPLRAGRHLRGAGEDVPLGVDLLPAGTAVTATVLGLAAEVGLDALAVRPRPAVAGLLTGAELVRTGGSGDGRVRDGIGPALPGWVRDLGGDPLPVRYVPEDTPADLVEAVAKCAADVVVTSGGAGDGPADQVVPALRELGATLVVDRVGCRPGRPMRLAALPDGRWWVVLPGSPYAGVVALLTLLDPLLAGLTGRPLAALPTAVLDVPAAGPVTRIVPVREVGRGAVAAVGPDRPGQLWGPALAHAYAVVPPDHLPGGAVDLLTFHPQ
ncbi:MAG TPA: molybdopterin-binding protein [Mycobacteriales bacterium]